MINQFLLIRCLLLLCLLLLQPLGGMGQVVENVPKAFEQLNTDPEVLVLENPLQVPREKGHLQGVQWVELNGAQKLLISGSSKHTAYILQADLTAGETETLIPLMKDPFRHAGGIQASAPHLIVGIEDNNRKTISKVILYQLGEDSTGPLTPKITINREGEIKRYTAGATGLIPLNDRYLAVVANWDSRHWDFYHVDPKLNTWENGWSFAAPNDWANYQSINLIKDEKAIYGIGLYAKDGLGQADLILISKTKTFKPIMSKVTTKAFNCKRGVDFQTAAGIQVDSTGNLFLWATQRDARQQIVINKYAPRK
ncbi:MAG: hypothetical protein HRU41_39555 [Saprospiraceae bacterium]|nr:hypothetical protein [Saprospiraceae bacterium]